MIHLTCIRWVSECCRPINCWHLQWTVYYYILCEVLICSYCETCLCTEPTHQLNWWGVSGPISSSHNGGHYQWLVEKSWWCEECLHREHAYCWWLRCYYWVYTWISLQSLNYDCRSPTPSIADACHSLLPMVQVVYQVANNTSPWHTNWVAQRHCTWGEKREGRDYQMFVV